MNPEIDYDKTWELVKNCILRNFAGDLDQGVSSPSVQNTLYVTEKDILEKIREIVSIEMTLPNKHYVSVDFSQFKKIVTDGEQNVYLPLDKPSGVIYAKLDRKSHKL
jgi:urate oxidase